MLAVHTQRGVLPSLAGCSAVAASSLAAMEAFSWAGPRRPSHPSHGATVLLGLGAFVALGGRFWAVNPSCLRSPGAFSNGERGSLAASVRYAGAKQRESIQQLGRKFGCHSCGVRFGHGLQFRADHQPPLFFVRRANAAWWRRLLGTTVTQRFYPQCAPCSSLQGGALSALAAGSKQLPPGAVRHAAQTFLLSASTWTGALLSGTVVAADSGVLVATSLLSGAEATVDAAAAWGSSARRGAAR